jgi:hypothetical protein
LKKVVDVRNRAHHELLSLAAWDDLDETAREGSEMAAYECCRLIAILYSTAVIFPQPAYSGWHMKLVRDVMAVLTSEVVDTWCESAPALLLWVLVVRSLNPLLRLTSANCTRFVQIAGIASFRTPEREFFKTSLQRTLRSRNYLLPKPAVRMAALREFIWSESAGGRGFAELWDALELGSVGELDVE